MNNFPNKKGFDYYVKEWKMVNPNIELYNEKGIKDEQIKSLENKFLTDYEYRRNELFTNSHNQNNSMLSSYNNLFKRNKVNLIDKLSNSNKIKHISKSLHLTSSDMYNKLISFNSNFINKFNFYVYLLDIINQSELQQSYDISNFNNEEIYNAIIWLELNPYLNKDEIENLNKVHKNIKFSYFIYFSSIMTMYNIMLFAYLYYRIPQNKLFKVAFISTFTSSILLFLLTNKQKIKESYIKELKTNYPDLEDYYYRRYI